MAERLPFKSSDFLRGLRVANQSALAGIIDACSQDSPEAVRGSIARGGGYRLLFLKYRARFPSLPITPM